MHYSQKKKGKKETKKSTKWTRRQNKQSPESKDTDLAPLEIQVTIYIIGDCIIQLRKVLIEI